MKKAFTPSRPKRIIGILVKGNGKPLIAKSTGRNEPCKCGSGIKAKKCHNLSSCGTGTKYFKQ